MREFLKVLEDDFKVINIDDEVTTQYEVSKIMKDHPKDVLIFNNVKESDMGIISGICNTREKIAKSISVTVPEITARIVEATEKPMPIEVVERISKNFAYSKSADLGELPVPTYYKKDGGAYITAGVIIAKDPETGVRNVLGSCLEICTPITRRQKKWMNRWRLQ